MIAHILPELAFACQTDLWITIKFVQELLNVLFRYDFFTICVEFAAFLFYAMKLTDLRFYCFSSTNLVALEWKVDSPSLYASKILRLYLAGPSFAYVAICASGSHCYLDSFKTILETYVDDKRDSIAMRVPTKGTRKAQDMLLMKANDWLARIGNNKLGDKMAAFSKQIAEWEANKKEERSEKEPKNQK